VTVAERAQLVELAGIAEDIDGDDGFRPLGDGLLDGGRIEVERARVDVDEDRRRALVEMQFADATNEKGEVIASSRRRSPTSRAQR
jgi:hypothetical protein